jgi:pyridoxine 5-phosphate synthase
MAAVDAMLDIALELRPMTVTLVPERREEVTTEGGLAIGLDSQRVQIGRAVARLVDADIRTSLFIDPEPAAVEAALGAGANAIELHTGAFAGCWPERHSPAGAARLAEETGRLRRAAAKARALALGVHAGHGLTYENVSPIAGIAELEELNIGHSIVSRAVLVGMERAVHEMRTLLSTSRALHGEVLA